MLRDRKLVLALGLLAALPVIVSTIRALVVGWVPLGDDAVIAVRAYDVFSIHPPLLGQRSTSSALADGPVHSLGPMIYWLLAVPARIGPDALVVTAGLVNTASVMGVVALARRRGGDLLMLLTAGAAAAMCWSFVPETLHSIWNPSLGLMPFALLVFTAWSVACGEHRLLPLGVVLASFVAQCHFTFVVPTAGLTAVALAGLLGTRRRAGGGGEGVRRSVAVALVAGIVCWSAPLVEQAIHRPGNLVEVSRAATADTDKLGLDAGWHTAVRTAGVPPWWLRRSPSQFELLSEVIQAPGAGTIASAGLLFALLLALCAPRGRPELAAGAAIALVLLAALALVAASTPSEGKLFLSIGYTLRWASIAGMFAWLVVAWGVATLLRPALAERQLRAPPRLAVAAVTAVAVIVAAGTRADTPEPRYDAANAAANAVAALPGDGRVTVLDSADRFDLHAAAVYALRRRREVRAPVLTAQLGGEYEQTRDPGTVVELTRRAPPRGRVVARLNRTLVIAVR